jgi:2'-5' RNA ligase
MRVFIGIAFDDEIKSYLESVKNIVMKGSDKGRFAETALFHLTLKFLGEVSESELGDIAAAMDEVAAKHDPFSLEFSHLGQFPSGKRKIIWLGIKAHDELQSFYGDLEEILAQIGYSAEGRPYVPHITFGRQVSLREPIQVMEAARDSDSPEIPVDRITLFHSTRVAGELRYLEIHSSALRPKSQTR